MIKKTSFFYLICIFVFLNIIDMLTTLFVLPGESNPLYLLTGSIISILIAKLVVIGVIVFMYFRNKYNHVSTYYLFVCTIVYASFALLVAQGFNIYGILHPSTIVQSGGLTTETKVASYNIFMIVIYLIPILFSMISFWIYNTSFKYIKIVKEKKRKWLFWKQRQ